MNNTNKFIQQELFAILDICKGLETPLKKFYVVSADDTLKLTSFINKLAKNLPNSITLEEKELYKSFFKMVIYFVESSCSDSDKTFVAFKKIANIDIYNANKEKTIFSIMLDNAKKRIADEKSNIYLKKCAKNYKSFSKLAARYYDKKIFSNNISYIIDEFAKQNHLMLSEQQLNSSSIIFDIKWCAEKTRQEYNKLQTNIK